MYISHSEYVSHSKYGTRYGVYKVSDYRPPNEQVWQGGPVPKPVLRVYERLEELMRHSDTLGIATLSREYSENSLWWSIEVKIGTRRVAIVNFANDTEEFYATTMTYKNGDNYAPITRATFNRKTREWFK